MAEQKGFVSLKAILSIHNNFKSSDENEYSGL